MSENTDKRRVDDSFGRKIILTLIVTVLAQGASFIYLTGAVLRQQDINTANIEKLLDMNDTLIAIKTQTESMTKAMEKLSGTLTAVAYEQHRRTPIVNQAQQFMIEHSKEHNGR